MKCTYCFGKTLLGIVVVLALAPAMPAPAQFICGGSATGNEPQASSGANAAGIGNNFACGPSADAGGNGSFNTAVGAFVNASGVLSRNVAIGSNADASGAFSTNIALGSTAIANGDNSSNVATGNSANASGNSSFNIAAGKNAKANGDLSSNVATGFGALANGDNSNNVAIGRNANASGSSSQNTAVGANSVATGNSSSAFGAGAQAPFINSAAFGNGAIATRPNQQVFGTAASTYTLPGLTSASSIPAQSGPTQLVTTDASGNLGVTSLSNFGLGSSADISALSARLDRKIGKSFTGVAMAFAVAGVPTVLPNEKFVLATNWGIFQGENGAALSAAIRIYHNVQLNGGFTYGFRENMAGGHAGLRFGF